MTNFQATSYDLSTSAEIIAQVTVKASHCLGAYTLTPSADQWTTFDPAVSGSAAPTTSDFTQKFIFETQSNLEPSVDFSARFVIALASNAGTVLFDETVTVSWVN